MDDTLSYNAKTIVGSAIVGINTVGERKISNIIDVKKFLTQPFKIKKRTIIKDLLDSISDEFLRLDYEIKKCENLVLYENNKGKQLDFLGSNFNEFRDGDDDENYLERIKFLKESSNSYGDENTIINVFSDYFNIDKNNLTIENIDIRKIKLTIPDGLDLNVARNLLLKIKAAGIRIQIELDKYWEDFTYEEIENYTYKSMEKYRYERGGKQ